MLTTGFYNKINNIINCYVIGPSIYPRKITSLICLNILISIFWLLDSIVIDILANNPKVIYLSSLITWTLLLIYIYQVFFPFSSSLNSKDQINLMLIIFYILVIFYIIDTYTTKVVSLCFYFFPVISWILTFLWIYSWMVSLNSWESQKFLTNSVQKNIIQGFYLFAISEIMLFFGFFWAFFHFAWAPSVELGGVWPPVFLLTVNPLGLPVLNTILLMSSGFLLSLGLKSNSIGSLKSAKLFVYMSILLGVYFLSIQRMEFLYSGFLPSQSIFGSAFFALTSLHGFHVILGMLALILFLFQIENSFSFKSKYINKYLSTSDKPNYILVFNGSLKDQNIGGFLASFYWHLVDAIWIFLVIILYFNLSLIRLLEITIFFIIIIQLIPKTVKLR